MTVEDRIYPVLSFIFLDPAGVDIAAIQSNKEIPEIGHEQTVSYCPGRYIDCPPKAQDVRRRTVIGDVISRAPASKEIAMVARSPII